MAEKISLEILLEADKADLTLGQLRDGMKGLEEELENTKRGTKRFEELSTAMAQTNREIKNMELSFEALDNEQVASEIGSVAGGIGDVTASLVLLGGENETMQEMAASIEKAMAISIGFKGAIEGISSASKLYNNLLKQGKIQTLLFGDATKKMTILQKLLNLAMKANPIMLIVTGIGLLAGAYLALSKEVDAATKVQEAYNEASKTAQKEVVKEEVKLNKLIATAKNENLTKSERQKAIKELNALSPEYLGNITLETINTEEATAAMDKYIASIEKKAMAQALETKIQEESLRLLELEEDAKEGKISGLASITQWTQAGAIAQDTANKQNWEAVRVQKEYIKGLIERSAAEQEAADGNNLRNAFNQIQTIDQDNLEKTVEKNRQDREKNRKRDRSNDIEIERVDSQRRIEIKEIEVERETELIGVQFDLNRALADEERRLFEERARLAEEADLRRQESLDKAQAGLDVLSSANEAFSGAEIQRIKDKEAAGEQISAKERARLEKDAKIKKKLAVAQLAIDTARAISGGIASAAAVPFPGNLVAILSTVAAVLSNVAQAKNLLASTGASVEGSSLSGAAASSGGAAGGVGINPVSNTSTILGDMQPVVEVVEINNKQKKVGVIEASATF